MTCRRLQKDRKRHRRRHFFRCQAPVRVFLDGIGAGQDGRHFAAAEYQGGSFAEAIQHESDDEIEDGNAQQIEAESLISVPVRQDARFEFSEFELESGEHCGRRRGQCDDQSL